MNGSRPEELLESRIRLGPLVQAKTVDPHDLCDESSGDARGSGDPHGPVFSRAVGGSLFV